MSRVATRSGSQSRARVRLPAARVPRARTPTIRQPVAHNPVARPAVTYSYETAQAMRGEAGLQPEQVLAMQQIAGNRAVSRMLATRQAAPKPQTLIQREEPAAVDGGEKPAEEKAAIPSAIGYLGMNPAAANEAKALKKVSKDQVMISLDDPKAQKSLKTPEGMGVFIYEKLGIDPTKDMDKFVAVFNVLNGTSSSAREQMGHMMQWFSGAEAGKYRIERLVFSGHSDGVDLWGDSDDDHDPGKFVLHRDLTKVTSVFPGAAAQVQDIMFSACWSVVAIEQMTKIFPNVQTVWGYIGFSPNVEQGSAKHIKKWEMTTRGDNTPEKRDRKGKAAIWTKADGYVAGSPGDYNLGGLVAYFNDNMGDDVRKMYLGEMDLDSTKLRDAYVQLQLISIHPDADAEKKKGARSNIQKILRLRYWYKIIDLFLESYKSEIDKSYKGFGVEKLSKIHIFKRSSLKKHMEAVEAELSKKEHADARDFLENKLRRGLWELDSTVIPNTWI